MWDRYAYAPTWRQISTRRWVGSRLRIQGVERGLFGLPRLGPSAVGHQRLFVIMSPRRIIIDDHLVDAGRKTEPDRNRQPLRSLCGLEAVPVLPLVLLLLYGVEPDEQIRLVHLVKVSEPGQ